VSRERNGVEYEYGIAFYQQLVDPHRTGFTKEEAEDWVRAWIEDGGRPGAFRVIRRPVGDWEIYEEETV
jgi:hypothetical protein